MTLSESLVRRPILRLPDHNKTFILRTDASNCGLGVNFACHVISLLVSF